MAEVKSAPKPESKKATPAPKQEAKSDVGELEYSDNRSSTAQLVSLQATADGNSNRSNTTQLQAKASSVTGASRVAQLKAASDISRPASSGAPVQLKTGVPVNNDPKLEREADVMGAKALQGKFMDSGSIANQTPVSTSKQPFQFVDSKDLPKNGKEGEWKKHQASLKGEATEDPQQKGKPGQGNAKEAAWNRHQASLKGEATEVPQQHDGDGSPDQFIASLENYLSVISKINFSDLKKEQLTIQNAILLEKAGIALSAAGASIGIGALAVALSSTGVGAVALAAAGLGVALAKVANDYGKKGESGGAKGAATLGGAVGAKSATAALAGQAVADLAAPGASVLMGIKNFYYGSKELIQLKKDQVNAKKELEKINDAMADLEAQITSDSFRQKIQAIHLPKLAAALQTIFAIKEKILALDKSLGKVDELILENQVDKF